MSHPEPPAPTEQDGSQPTTTTSTSSTAEEGRRPSSVPMTSTPSSSSSGTSSSSVPASTSSSTLLGNTPTSHSRRPSSSSDQPSSSPGTPNPPLPSPAPRVHVRMSHGPPPKSHSHKKPARPNTAPAQSSDTYGSRGAFLPSEPGSAPSGLVASPSPVPTPAQALTAAAGLGSPRTWARQATPAKDELGEPVHIPPHPPTPGAAAAYAEPVAGVRDGLGAASSWPLIGPSSRQGEGMLSSESPAGAGGEGGREGGREREAEREREEDVTPTPSKLAPTTTAGEGGTPSAGAQVQAAGQGLGHSPSRPPPQPQGSLTDWRSFVQAYALGRWDPNRTPNQPTALPTPLHGSFTNAPVSAPSATLGRGIPPTGGVNPHMRRSISSGPGGVSSPYASSGADVGGTVAAFNKLSVSAPGASEVLSPPSSVLGSGSSGGSGVETASTAATSADSPLAPSMAVPLAIESEKPLPPVPAQSLAQRRGAFAPDLSAHTSTTYMSAPPPSIFSPTRAGSDLGASMPPTQRMSFPPRTPGTPGTSAAGEGRTPLPSPSVEAAAATATIRWAGARVDVAPLSLPSPESELMDPLRGFNISIPGTHDQPGHHGHRLPVVPRVAPKGSFWEGTQDVYTTDGQRSPHPPLVYPYGLPGAAGGTPLDPIAGSPLTTPEREDVPGSSTVAKSPSVHPHPALSPSGAQGPQGSYFRSMGRRVGVPPASAPLPHSRVVEAAGDYFSDARTAAHMHGHVASRLRNAISPSNSSEGSGSPAGTIALGDTGGSSSAPTVTGTPPPNLSRRTTDPEHLAHISDAQTAQMQQIQTPMYAALSLAGISGLDKRTKEEREFTALGFFVPPQPPDEEERRKALYRFNVMHTARDVNFDRIAHLAKLVFKTKMVYISLVDAAEQWFKAECFEAGVGVPSVARDVSFCGHCILQRGDEPMIVLDATKDWRFQRNPLVTGPPHIRFYAGAPLRTHEGYNIGSLCVIDDVPWTEFTPRQRHTLKEFAAIVMRELELWRDKIQLRIRDRIQTSMEHFTRECLEMDTNEPDSMNRVYDRAAKLVKRTLDVEGALVLDISHLELMETVDENGKPNILFHGDPYGVASNPPSSSSLSAPTLGQAAANGGPGGASNTILHRKFEFGPIPPLPVLGAAESGVEVAARRGRPLTAIEHAKLSDFLVNYPDGKIYEGLVPLCFRHMLPNHIQYAMIVPVWSIDKNCFVLLLAYTTDISKHYLEGYELQYLRAIGVIILSSMLKRRMQLADKAKSHFISNISHELRTPLHGILAAAELLADTRLSGTQASFLHTVQACATSLVETVNHVLDFTKLSGSKGAHAQPEQPIKHGYMDLITLVEETTENCFIGQQARAMGEIGSVYAPSALADDDPNPAALTKRKWARVEIVVDIGLRKKGWNVLIERGGIRRVLTNLIGNSLKFTSDGFVQVSLRESQEPAGPGMIRVELIVTDTGKGISKDFLKNQLFHPFSQENPMQSGTGLGLAIVNSIVRSESVNGKVDVWSVEGQGTEIKVSFDAEVVPSDDSRCGENPAEELDVLGSASVSLIGFDQEHRGQALACQVIKGYLRDWWDFDVKTDENDLGNILIVNEDVAFVRELVRKRDVSRPVIILSAIRGDQKVSAVCDAYERMGGLIAVVFKPGGPSRLLKALKLCLNDLDVRRRGQVPRSTSENLIQTTDKLPVEARDYASVLGGSSSLRIRPPGSAMRPAFVRSRTDSGDLRFEGRPPPPQLRPDSSLSNEEKYLPTTPEQREDEPTMDSPGSPRSIVSIGNGGVMVRSAMTSNTAHRKARVLVIEDNPINRRVLGSYLSKRGHQYYEAIDGQDGVERFNAQPPWFFDIVLVDMSMPRLDGVETTVEIRKSEAQRRRSSGDGQGKASTIFALTGLATAEDKRKAFNAGVDGYLVKPVSLKSLDEVFSNLGFS